MMNDEKIGQKSQSKDRSMKQKTGKKTRDCNAQIATPPRKSNLTNRLYSYNSIFS